jgi:hypothetical protein
MNKSTIAGIILVAGSVAGLAPSIAVGQSQSGLNIGDNDSVYIDGKSFQVIPGTAKGDTAAQIKNLSARDLGPAAIIFRSGDKLYIADAQSQMVGAQAQASVPVPTNYAYDPRASNPRLSGGGSTGYNNQVATDYAYDPRAYKPTLQGGGSTGYNNQVATDYAYDPQAVRPSLSGGGSAGYNQNAATNYAYDPQAVRPSLSGGGSAGYNQNVATDYAYDPRAVRPSLSGGGSAGYNQNVATDYAYDPRAINPRLSGGGSAGYNNQVATDYAYDPRQGWPIRNPNPWANDYAYDPRSVAAAQPSLIYDSDYVEYRLKKAFEDNWTPVGTPTATK